MLAKLLRKLLPFKEIGWKDVGEEFTRWTIIKAGWWIPFNLYLHRMWAPHPHPLGCHNHPWHFLAIVLWGGYWEEMNGKTKWRGPGSILWRPANSLHQTTTAKRANWSIIFTTKKLQDWGFRTCE